MTREKAQPNEVRPATIPPTIISDTETRRTLSRLPWPCADVCAVSCDTLSPGTAAAAAAAAESPPVIERLRDGTAEG